MRDPFRRLLAGLDGGPVMLSADDRRAFVDDWDALVAAGLVTETASATAALCDSCHDPCPSCSDGRKGPDHALHA